MFLATRRRLAIWYTAVTAVLLLLFAIGVYWYVRTTLIERMDDTLNHVVEVVERSLAIEPISIPANPTTHTPLIEYRVNVEASFRDNADHLEDDRIDLEWFNGTGDLLWSTFREPLEIALHPNRTGETVALPSGQLLRQVTERIEIGRQVLGYLRVSHPWFEVTKPTRQLIIDLTIGISLMVISVAASGWFLSGLAMKPILGSYQRLKQFTADASHELRSPIAIIQTNVQVALADPQLQSQHHRQELEVIERLTRRLGRLVDDLLFLARQDSGMVQQRFEMVHLDALLIEVIEEQKAIAADKKITLALDLLEPTTYECAIDSDGCYSLPGDWDQLARLFTNLVSNAVQYTPPEGQVDVTLQPIGRASHPQLQVQVKDNGIGIPEEALPYLFDRFYRVDPARSHGNVKSEVSKIAGSGLGLAIAKAIVQNHHGEIQIHTQLKQGTTLIVTLPGYRPDTGSPSTKSE